MFVSERFRFLVCRVNDRSHNDYGVFETCRLLPESVVWLYANNRVAEAEKIIRDAAKLNNITMPDKILAQPAGATVTADSDGKKAEDDGKLLDKLRKVRTNSGRSEETRYTRYTVLDIFRNRHLTVYAICMVLLWSVHLMSRSLVHKAALVSRHLY